MVGVFLGAFAGSKLSGDRSPERVPPLWRWRFGDSPIRRYIGAFGGGFIMMLGARIAQGCTSGHGISGALQLALSSWMFAPLIFAVAVGTAFLIYGKEGRNHV
ncbi:YeeE/YedE thiosulfate transporter family protein [Geotalea toluenoxydans]|uniref:YeeE/YedE thiosulfate transporter family protein n=1 Tax=Geotalea toluenoxydans TaxID=421624 RepID=UPI000A488D2F|nr:YeeE/YedE thiosulfate transporter family protein [Geotalea toluenoxydans]